MQTLAKIVCLVVIAVLEVYTVLLKLLNKGLGYVESKLKDK